MTVSKGMVYSYNAENRLIEAAPQNPQQGSVKSTYIYDYMGRRARKTLFTFSSGSWQKQKDQSFIYDGWNMVKESEKTSDSSPEVPVYYVWGLDLSQSMQGAGGVGGLIASVKSGNEYLYSYDANGNVGQMVKSSDGSIAARYEYDPFGKTLFSEGQMASENLYRFSTKYLDGETGFYYYGYRYYYVELGRWINRDPMGEKGEKNLYNFVRNASLKYVDLLGLVFAGVDGTSSLSWMSKAKDGRWKSHVRNFFEDYHLEPGEAKAYHSGPNQEYTGGDAPEIHARIMEFISDELCKNPCQQVNLVGHSRGGYIVMQIARELGVKGVYCSSRGLKMYPRVNFLGLYEAVDMTPRYGDSEKIPYNVDYTAHAINDSNSQILFNVADDGRDWDKNAYQRKVFDVTHSGIGGDPWNGDYLLPYLSGMTQDKDIKGSKNANDWMRINAGNAGINFGISGDKFKGDFIAQDGQKTGYYEVIRCSQ